MESSSATTGTFKNRFTSILQSWANSDDYSNHDDYEEYQDEGINDISSETSSGEDEEEYDDIEGGGSMETTNNNNNNNSETQQQQPPPPPQWCEDPYHPPKEENREWWDDETFDDVRVTARSSLLMNMTTKEFVDEFFKEKPRTRLFIAQSLSHSSSVLMDPHQYSQSVPKRSSFLYYTPSVSDEQILHEDPETEEELCKTILLVRYHCNVLKTSLAHIEHLIHLKEDAVRSIEDLVYQIEFTGYIPRIEMITKFAQSEYLRETILYLTSLINAKYKEIGELIKFDQEKYDYDAFYAIRETIETMSFSLFKCVQFRPRVDYYTEIEDSFNQMFECLDALNNKDEKNIQNLSELERKRRELFEELQGAKSHANELEKKFSDSLKAKDEEIETLKRTINEMNTEMNVLKLKTTNYFLTAKKIAFKLRESEKNYIFAMKSLDNLRSSLSPEKKKELSSEAIGILSAHNSSLSSSKNKKNGEEDEDESSDDGDEDDRRRYHSKSTKKLKLENQRLRNEIKNLSMNYISCNESLKEYKRAHRRWISESMKFDGAGITKGTVGNYNGKNG